MTATSTCGTSADCHSATVRADARDTQPATCLALRERNRQSRYTRCTVGALTMARSDLAITRQQAAESTLWIWAHTRRSGAFLQVGIVLRPLTVGDGYTFVIHGRLPWLGSPVVSRANTSDPATCLIGIAC